MKTTNFNVQNPTSYQFRVQSTINFNVPGYCQTVQLSVSEAKELVKAINKELQNLKGDQK